MRLALALAVALPLAAADLVWKALVATPTWAYHERSPGWLALSVALLAAVLLATRVPSTVVACAAGVLAGGVLGNALSAAWNGLAVANPIVLEGSDAVVAFNLADVFVVVGIAALVVALGLEALRQRTLLRRPG
jgi:lipoprotein signal peptidase